MTYTINKSDGTKLVDVLDSNIDTTTDLKLIGKNTTTFGEYLNENLIYLLENFSNSTPPSKPLVGQVWYSTAEKRLQVYTGNVDSWRPAGSPIVSSSQPTNFVAGDLWINTVDKQLYFYDGYSLTLSGQPWTKSQGVTGIVAKTVYDSNGNYRSILQLYVKDVLLGIFSSDAFTLSDSTPIVGFSKISIGYTSNASFSSSYDIKAIDSQKLNGFTSNSFLRSDSTADPITGIANSRSIMSVPLSVTSQEGITLGTTGNVNIRTSGLTLQIENTVNNGDISLRTTQLDGTINDNIFISSSNGNVGIFTTEPQRQLDINGATRIQGTLEVTGKILTAPIELTLVDNDILGYPQVTGVVSTGASQNFTITVASVTGIYQGMTVTGSAGLGTAATVTAIDVGTKIITLSVRNVGSVSGPLTFTDNLTIKTSTVNILTDIAPTIYYLPNQTALVHYQHINFSTQAITRYLKKYVIKAITNLDGSVSGVWEFDSDLTPTV